MTKARLLPMVPARCLIAALIFFVLPSGSVWAAMPQGRIKQDMTVGPNHNIQLKAGQVVDILNNSGAQVVIMAKQADGSSTICQIDAAGIDAIAAPPPAPVPAPAPTSAPAPPPVVAPPVRVVTAPTAPTADSPPAPTGPPTYPDDFVGGPEFNTTAGTRAAGTASVVKVKGSDQSYIVSARHLLGPEGGFEKQMAARDVPTGVKSIRIEAFSGGTRTYDVTGLLVPTERLQADAGSPIDDMAIYLNHDPSPQSQAVVLSEPVPAVGTPLWVVAHVRGGVPEGQVLQPGKVTSTRPWIIMQFDNDKIVTAGASGAPVLNAAGEVVGVYSGHSKEHGHVMGYLIPAALIVQTIKTAPPPAP